jgi:Fe-S-cluster containining protein
MRTLQRTSGRDRICLACRDKTCCSYYTVTVTGGDLLRIARSMQLAATDFLTACRVADEGPGTFLLDPQGSRYALTLARRPFPDPSAAPCVFLLRTNDRHSLCGLGDLRPVQCRVFPSYLADDFVSLVNEPPGCVRTWSYGDVDLEEERHRIVQARAEEAEHNAAVDEWNHRVRGDGGERSFEEFCTFLVNRRVEHEENGCSASGPCSSCRKRCCASYTVSITGYDAWVIGKGLYLPLESFLIYFPVSEPNERGFLLEPGGPRHEIALDKVGAYQKGNACVFWVELAGGGGRCGIYAHRPMVCQTYPAYQQQEMVVLRDDVLCPQGAWNLVGMDLPSFRQRLSRFRMEQDIYAYFVAGWNGSLERSRRRVTIREYYAALMNVYEKISRWSEAVSHNGGNKFTQAWGELHWSVPNPLFADIEAPGRDSEWHSHVAALRGTLHGSAPWLAEFREPVPAGA